MIFAEFEAVTPFQQPFNPLVSVVIPTYQQEDVILFTVQSALNQTYENIEVIVVVDGSTDGTLDKLEQIKDHRLIVLSKENGGVALARNDGVLCSSGEYIAFLDGDDLWLPNKLQCELEVVFRSKIPECIVYSGYYAVDEKRRLLSLSTLHRDTGEVLSSILKKEHFLLPSATLIHRKVFDTVKGFEPNSYHEDRTFFLKATRLFPAYPTKKRLLVYQQTMSGRFRNILSDYEAALKAELSIVESMKSVLSSNELSWLKDTQLKSLLRRFLKHGYLNNAKKLYENRPSLHAWRVRNDILVVLSIKTSINFLSIFQKTTQLVCKYALLLWWRKKMNPVLSKPTKRTLS